MKRFIIAFGLLLILYASACGSYINYGNTDNIYFLGLIDVLIISLIMMIAPFILKISNKLNSQNCKKICKYNSLIAFIISVLITAITDSSNFVGIGGLGALFYYYININMFGNFDVNTTEQKQQKKEQYNKKEKHLTRKFNFEFLNINKMFIIVIIILTIIIIIESIFIIKEQNYADELKKEIISLKGTVESSNNSRIELLKENIILRNKSNFMDEYIVFVLDGYGKYYYTYDCMKEVTEGKEYSFWVYSINNAIAKGYKPFKCSN